MRKHSLSAYMKRYQIPTPLLLTQCNLEDNFFPVIQVDIVDHKNSRCRSLSKSHYKNSKQEPDLHCSEDAKANSMGRSALQFFLFLRYALLYVGFPSRHRRQV